MGRKKVEDRESLKTYGSIRVRMSKNDLDILKKECEASGRTMSEIVRYAVSMYLDKDHYGFYVKPDPDILQTYGGAVSRSKYGLSI